MKLREQLAPLTTWTEQDIQNWCIEHPFVELCETPDGLCLLEAIVRSRGLDVRVGSQTVRYRRSFGLLQLQIPLSDVAKRVVLRFDQSPWDLPVTVIDVAARMWPDVFAEEVQRLIEQVPVGS